MYRLIVSVLVAGLVAGCVTERRTDTTRTATEELLVSTAADRAAVTLAAALPVQSSVYLDTGNLSGDDGKYAIGSIQDALLRRGCVIMPKQSGASVIVALRAGALATNSRDTLIGLPAITLPIPLAGAVTTPTVALYDVDKHQGVASFAATATDAKTGRLVARDRKSVV